MSTTDRTAELERQLEAIREAAEKVRGNQAARPCDSPINWLKSILSGVFERDTHRAGDWHCACVPCCSLRSLIITHQPVSAIEALLAAIDATQPTDAATGCADDQLPPEFVEAARRHVAGTTPESITNGPNGEQAAELARLQAENVALRSAVFNQCGDNLCWVVTPETAKALPEAEFLESCRRYRQQIADERGEFTGGRTIAQLEAELARVREELRAAVSEWNELKGWHFQMKQRAESAEAELARVAELVEQARKKINDCCGGMDRSSVIWPNAPYDRGWRNGLTAALTAFDSALADWYRKRVTCAPSAPATSGEEK